MGNVTPVDDQQLILMAVGIGMGAAILGIIIGGIIQKFRRNKYRRY